MSFAKSAANETILGYDSAFDVVMVKSVSSS